MIKHRRLPERFPAAPVESRASIVHHNVNMTKFLLNLLEHSQNFFFLCKITLDGSQIVRALWQLSLQLLDLQVNNIPMKPAFIIFDIIILITVEPFN